MHDKLRRAVADGCIELVKRELCDFGFGTVSLYDHTSGVIIINPKGLPVTKVTPESVIAALPSGEIVDGAGELPYEFETHAVIYKAFSGVSAVASSCPTFATSFAQAGRSLKPYGTAHAALFGDMIPCTRKLTPSEIASDCAKNVGKLIVEAIESEPNLLSEVGAALVYADGIYTFGSSPTSAVCKMAAAEKIARMAFYTEMLQRQGAAGGTRMQEDLLRCVYDRTNKK